MQRCITKGFYTDNIDYMDQWTLIIINELNQIYIWCDPASPLKPNQFPSTHSTCAVLHVLLCLVKRFTPGAGSHHPPPCQTRYSSAQTGSPPPRPVPGHLCVNTLDRIYHTQHGRTRLFNPQVTTNRKGSIEQNAYCCRENTAELHPPSSRPFADCKLHQSRYQPLSRKITHTLPC